MKAIFGILFFVLFGAIGARVAGFAGTALISAFRFESPDQVDQFTWVAYGGITLVIAVIGAFIGVCVAGRLRPLFFRKQS